MTKLTIVTSTIALGLFVMGSAGHVAAAPSVQPVQPSAQLQPKDRPQPKRLAKLTVQWTAAVAGETRNVKAVLTSGNAKLANKPITFKFEGKALGGQNVVINIGTDRTNADGEAVFPWKVPELAKGPHTLKATFAGEDDIASASDEASFGTVAGITKVELADVNYGYLDSHGGPKFHKVIIRLRRQADNEWLNKVVKVWVTTGSGNNTKVIEKTVDLGRYGAAMTDLLLEPPTAPQWTLRVDFPGDDANQASSQTRVYNRVPGS